MDDLHVELADVVEALRRRLSDAHYENAVLSVAVDQLRARIRQLESNG